MRVPNRIALGDVSAARSWPELIGGGMLLMAIFASLVQISSPPFTRTELLLVPILLTAVGGSLILNEVTPTDPRLWLVPLMLVRIVLPSVPIAMGRVPSWPIGISEAEWVAGAAAGLAATAAYLGSLVGGMRLGVWARWPATGMRRLRIPHSLRVVAAVAALLGVASLGFALVLNYGALADVALSGVARGGQRVAGTSRYVQLGTWLLILAPALWELGGPRRSSMGVVLASLGFAVLTIMGGRVVAAAPVFLYLIVRAGDGAGSRMSRKQVAAVGLVLLVLGGVYAIAVSFYRGGGGVERVTQLVTGELYVEENPVEYWMNRELTAVYPYALAESEAPGSVDAALWGEALAGPFGFLFQGDSAIRPGVYLAHASGQAPEAEWGYHTGAYIDAYLVSGKVAAVSVVATAGLLTGFAFTVLVRSPPEDGRRLSVLTYGLVLWTSIWFFFESLVVLNAFLTVGGLLALGLVFVAQAMSPATDV